KGLVRDAAFPPLVIRLVPFFPREGSSARAGAETGGAIFWDFLTPQLLVRTVVGVTLPETTGATPPTATAATRGLCVRTGTDPGGFPGATGADPSTAA